MRSPYEKKRTEANARRWRKRHPLQYRATTTFSNAKLFVRRYSTLETLNQLEELIKERVKELKGDDK